MGDEEEDLTQKTAIEALACKLSCCKLRYCNDDFIQYFWKKPFVRKAPIINRGYFGRIECISEIVNSFLSMTEGQNEIRQIINLGIGFDTFSLQLIQKDHSNLSIFEVDFQEIIVRKVDIMLSEPAIRNTLKLVDEQSTIADSDHSSKRRVRVNFSQYETHPGCFRLGDTLSLVSADLRHTDAVVTALQNASVDASLPTLIITECVLVYLPKKDTLDLCSAMSSLFSRAVWASYDMVNPGDAFGRVMRSNLQTAGLKLPGFIEFGSLSAQQERFILSGWEEARSCDMLMAYGSVISEEKRRRVQSLEIFDEVEEWQLLMSHYCLTVAVKGSVGTSSLQNIFEYIHLN